MSEYPNVRVVSIQKVGKHPNADTLSITTVHGKTPVIFRTGAFNQGDIACYIPVDSLVPVDRPEFSWLAKDAKNGVYRVKATRIRGVPSHGFLVPVPPSPDGATEYKEGDEVSAALGVTKYEPGPCYQIGGEIAGDIVTNSALQMIPYYDIENVRKLGERLFLPDEEVVVTEKVHGSNGRWVGLEENGVTKVYCGSRTKFRNNSVWNEMAKKYGLNEESVNNCLGYKENHGLVLFGEVYGPGIQDLTYDVPAGERRVVFFDIYDTKAGRFWDYDRFSAFCTSNGLPTAPVLYRGPYSVEKVYKLAEGNTVLGGGCHVREGVVVRPVVERWDSSEGLRVQLKLPGEGYLLRDKANGPTKEL